MNHLYADVNGIKICYNIQGKDFPIILIHGFGAKKEIWNSQVIILSETFRTIAIDLRGTGKSDRPNELYTMDVFADDIKGLMDYLKIEKAHVIGRSFGGMVAQHFALKYPNNLEKLILMNTIADSPSKQAAEIIEDSALKNLESRNQNQEKAFWENARILFYQKFRKEMEANPEKKFYDIWSANDLIKENTIDPSRPQDIKNRANAIKTHNTINRLCEIKNKTLLIASSHDRLTPRSSMIEMHNRIPNSTLKIIEKAGHLVNLSRALEINQIIFNFLLD